MLCLFVFLIRPLQISNSHPCQLSKAKVEAFYFKSSQREVAAVGSAEHFGLGFKLEIRFQNVFICIEILLVLVKSERKIFVQIASVAVGIAAPLWFHSLKLLSDPTWDFQGIFNRPIIFENLQKLFEMHLQSFDKHEHNWTQFRLILNIAVIFHLLQSVGFS